MIKYFYYINIILLHILTYVKAIKIFFTEFYRYRVVRKNSSLSSRRNSDVCYICALGPSLKQVDLNLIKEDTIVVNRFHRLSDQYPDFIPTHYVLVDATFGTLYREELDSALEKYSDRGTNFILNSKFAKLKLEEKWNNLFYISNFKGEFYGQDFRLDRIVPSFSNVVGVAIGVALGMGYKKIVLLGCDFNSFASPISNHCYAEADNSRQIRLWYELYRYAIVAWGHEQFQKYAKRKGVQILNSTKGSLIDAYPFEIDNSLYRD